MISLSCDRLALAFGEKEIFRDVSFSLQEGDHLGIVGVNGAGKSSLLKILTGTLPPSDGSLYLAKYKTVAMLEQNALPPDSDKSAEEELLLCCEDLLREEQALAALQADMEAGNSAAAESYPARLERFTEAGGFSFRGRCKGLLRALGFSSSDAALPVNKLSGGQKTRLALGRILFREPDLLILDEPTNHLDIDTLRWLEEHLRDYRKTVITVSHDRYFLDRVTNKILDLENGHGKLYTGNYSVFAEKKRKDREIQERHYRNQQREIARIEAYIEQQRRWNRERNIIAAESRQKLLDKMEREERPENLPAEITLRFHTAIQSGEDVLTVRELSGGYGGKPLFAGLSFPVKKGDRLLILGQNGCGKSTLLKILADTLSPLSGEYRYGYNVKPGYYDQENQQLREDATVLDELWDAYPDLTQTEVRTALAMMRFTGDDVFKPVGKLSGGERARLTLAKLSLSRTNLLILDEPTNHLDMDSREVLEEALRQYDGTVIAVSHDRYFVGKLATKLLIFREGSATPFFFDGSFDEYLAYTERVKDAAANGSPAAPAPISDAKEQYLLNKKKGAEERKRRNRIREATAEAEKIEGRLTEIETETAANESDHLLLTRLYAEKEALEEKLLSLYETLDTLGEEI